LAIFLLAFLLRALAAVGVAVFSGGTLFLDDASYVRLASAVADGHYGTLNDYHQWLYGRTGTMLVPVTALFWAFGSVTLVGQLWIGLLGAATAALTTRLALELVSRRWALLAGAFVAVLPSQILWSSIILKDSSVWAILSCLAVVVAVAGRSENRRLAVMGVSAAALLTLLGWLRLHTLEVSLIALWIAVAVQALLGAPQRVQRVIGVTVIAAGIPLLFSMGPFGATFVKESRNPTVQRSLNAQGAQTAVVSPEKTDGSKPTATDAIEDDTSAGAELSYLPTGLTVVALRPWPWESTGGIGVKLARLESLVWYPLVLLGLVGLVSIATAPARLRVMTFPLLAGGGILIMYGLTEGNIGTAFRHRGEIVWIVLLLAALGLEWLWRRRRAAEPEPPSENPQRTRRSARRPEAATRT
jgi:hypothetical protein